ncbi:MAG: hypothetical protein JWM19_769, partial [Actinomycetia bacterium]|nr:hypothetical protein [Actinomycetes bacterium]
RGILGARRDADDPDTRMLVRQLLKCIDAGWDVADR